MLTQLDDDVQEFVMAYVGQSYNKTIAKYKSSKGEYLIIIWANSPFHYYFYGSPFTLVMNHQPLKSLMELDGNVDGLTQNPSSNKKDPNGVHWYGDVDLEVVLSWHVFAYLCILLGCFGNAPHSNMGNKDSCYANIKPKGDGALNILDDALLLHTYKQLIEVSIGLTHKEHDWVVHGEKNSNGNAIPFYKCGQLMDNYRLCIA